MILTVTLNPAIDVSYHVQHFQIGHGHRVENGNKTAGGKGLNVSRVLQQLNSEVLCTGLLGGSTGTWIKNQLDSVNLMHDFLEITGETRTCLAMLDPIAGTQTELMERGPTISKEEVERFRDHFKHLCQKANIVIASGSMPKGMPSPFYQEMGEITRELHIPFLLDTSGNALTEGIEGRPFLIKPNEMELRAYVGRELSNEEEMLEAAKIICNKGVQYVLLSLGSKGAILVGQENILKAEIPEMEVKNPVGSGDSMLAGMAYALQQGFSISKSLAFACACGMANAVEEQTGYVEKVVVEKLVPQVKVTPLNEGR
ncbi:1-phosphofructokinase [Lederbergia graminis]|uniref:Tagatose-6-phosphate kinase n=1 Tax=Lederbergia graminis TaxID=735518 RepID=A0ABW0LFP3_9BACI